MRESCIDAFHIRQMHLLHHIDGAGLGFGAGQIAVHVQHFLDLLAHPQNRVQRGHRFLKDHRDPPRPQGPHLRRLGLGNLDPFQINRPALNFQRILGQQPHGRQRGDRFARPAFAHQTMGLARADIQINPAQHRIGLGPPRQPHRQPAYFQNAFGIGKVFGLEFHLTPPAFSYVDQGYRGPCRPTG